MQTTFLLKLFIFLKIKKTIQWEEWQCFTVLKFLILSTWWLGFQISFWIQSVAICYSGWSMYGYVVWKGCLNSFQFSLVQFSHLVMSDSLRPHESQHARPPSPSPTPRVHSDSRPSSQGCHPAISSSVSPFSSCPQSFPASESFPINYEQSFLILHHN